MPTIITLDVEQAAKRTGKQIQVRPEDLVTEDARELAQRLGVRIVGGSNGSARTADAPTVVTSYLPGTAPAPRWAIGGEASDPPAASAVPITVGQPAANVLPVGPIASIAVLPPVAALPSPVTQPRILPPATGPQIARPLSFRDLPQPAASQPPAAVPLAVPLAPIAVPVAPMAVPVQLAPLPPSTPAPVVAPLPPLASTVAPSAPLVTPYVPPADRPVPAWKRRRVRAAQRGNDSLPVATILGRIIQSGDIAVAIEADMRFVRVAADAYVTRAARRAADLAGVAIYPDGSVDDIDESAGAIINALASIPQLTRTGSGIVRTNGLPIGGDKDPGTLRDDE